MMQACAPGRAKYQQPRSNIWLALDFLIKRMQPDAVACLLMNVPALFDAMLTHFARNPTWTMAECLLCVFEALKGEVGHFMIGKVCRTFCEKQVAYE